MKSIIALDRTVFDFVSFAGNHGEMIDTMGPNGALIRITDFATVLIGWNNLSAEIQSVMREALELDTSPTPILSVPETWTMAHLMHALGAFSSVGEAKRNGWNKPIGHGIESHICRIRKIKGLVTTYRAILPCTDNP